VKRWVGFVAITMVMGGCSVNELCEALDELCVDDGLGDGGDDAGWPGDDDDDAGEDGMEPPDEAGEEGGEPPFDPCLEEYEWCLAEMGDESCDEILQWCEPPEPPPEPPIDPCFEEYEWCLQELGEDAGCEEILFGCEPEPPEPPEPDPCEYAFDACFQDFDACLYESPDPIECEQNLDACFAEADELCGWGGEGDGGGMDEGGMGDGGPDPIDQCFEEADACFLAGEDPQICDELLNACLEAC